jgi:purine-binding chemotaxis protein CheW
MSAQAKKHQLADQQVALHAYLDALLQEVPEAEPVQTKPIPVQLEEKIQEPVTPVEVPEEQVIVQEETLTETVKGPSQEVISEIQLSEENIVPEWGQSAFQCLVFKVAGLSLAIPLVKLNGVIPWSDEITPMPGHSAKFLGLLRRLDQNVKVIDTAQVVLPDKYSSDTLGPAEERISNILIMDEGRWGMACDEIGEVVTLESSNVRWRTSKGKRPWLAGTVLERLWALLDTDAFVDLLVDGEE